MLTQIDYSVAKVPLLAAALGLGLFAPGCSSPSQSSPSENEPDARGDALAVRTRATDIAKCTGTNLQPVWDSTNPNGTWGASVYQSIRQKGFTCVRFVLFWDQFEQEKGKWSSAAFASLEIGFDRARDAGLKVIVDAVHLVGQPEGQAFVPVWARKEDGMAAVAENGLPFLQQIASRFGNHPAMGAYDPVNEPFRYDPIRSASVLEDYTTIIDAIREVDPATPIMIEPTGGLAKVTARDFDSLTPASRANLIWSIHDYYAGGAGDGFKPDGGTAGEKYETWNGKTGYSRTAQHKQDMAASLQVSIDIAKSQGMPLWIGEFGVGRLASGHDPYIEDKVALYKSKGLGYAWWEYKDDKDTTSFSMIDGRGAWYGWVDKLK